MSLFSGLIQSKQTEEGFDLFFDDAKIQMNESMSEFKCAEKDFESVFAACNTFFNLCDAIDANNGMLEPSVREFVDHNQELSHALGITFALEDDQQAQIVPYKQNSSADQAKKENGSQVTEKKQGIIRKAWEAIKAFFKKIWGFIKKVFGYIKDHFVYNRFAKLSRAAEKFAPIIEATPVGNVLPMSKGGFTVENAKAILSESESCKNFFDSVVSDIIKGIKSVHDVSSWSEYVSSLNPQQKQTDFLSFDNHSITDDVPGSSTYGKQFNVPEMSSVMGSSFNVKFTPGMLKAEGWFSVEQIKNAGNTFNKFRKLVDNFEPILLKIGNEFDKEIDRVEALNLGGAAPVKTVKAVAAMTRQALGGIKNLMWSIDSRFSKIQDIGKAEKFL